MISALLCGVGQPSAWARDFRVTQLPNGSRFGCATCHVSAGGGGTRNAFGNDVFAIVGSSGARVPFWTPELAAKDSDGDGFSNGQELGDPDGDGTPIPGAVVTRPGLATSKPQNQVPSVQITGPPNGTHFTPPAIIDITAAAADTDGTIVRVEFLSQGAVVFTDTEAPYVWSVPASALAEGSHSITARATDNVGGTATSTAVQIVVNAVPANQSPTVQITQPASGADFTSNAAIVVQADAADPDDGVAKVQFFIDGNMIVEVPTAPYTHTIAAGALQPGNYLLVARAFDKAGATTDSGVIQLTVTAEPPTPVAVGLPNRVAEGFKIAWTGGNGPFVVQRKISLADTNWSSTATMTTREASLPDSDGSGFFRVADLSALTVIPFSAVLSGAAERPTPVDRPGTGSGILRLEGNTLVFDIDYSGLSGPAIAAHIHGPAGVEESGDVMIDLKPFNGGAFGSSGKVSGSVALSPAQRSTLLDGRAYVNFHTQNHGAGEIRGQIILNLP